MTYHATHDLLRFCFGGNRYKQYFLEGYDLKSAQLFDKQMLSATRDLFILLLLNAAPLCENSANSISDISAINSIRNKWFLILSSI